MAFGDSLVISDLQIPYHEPKALEFCCYVKKHYKIKDEHVYCVGDESDNYWGGAWKKSPDAAHTARQELKASQEEFSRWYNKFPLMKIAISNHGTRWMRKAFDAEIPSQMIRSYCDIIQSPEGWQWRQAWDVKDKFPWRVEHGDHWGGQYPHKQAALHLGRSVVIGHHHSLAGIEHMQTATQQIWGMITGCLIDFESYAFDYARGSKFKPCLGVGLVTNNGRTPQWLPFE